MAFFKELNVVTSLTSNYNIIIKWNSPSILGVNCWKSLVMEIIKLKTGSIFDG